MDNRARITLYGVGGAYLLYLSYKLFTTALQNGFAASVEELIFAVLFLILGAGVLVLTFKISRREEDEDTESK